ncbi:RNA-binding S4 domain-containing protein [Oscillospiraceae bacterium OttesenSCG-928-F05]|nr:RNA-binding S4 domain-containing protein [Oscillospiraceae bacterium OttesenSCG-928-F05]
MRSEIHTPFIRLDALLKHASVCASGGEAKLRILEGDVRLNGVPCTQRGKKIYPGDKVEIDGEVIEVSEAP